MYKSITKFSKLIPLFIYLYMKEKNDSILLAVFSNEMRAPVKTNAGNISKIIRKLENSRLL